MASRSGFSSRIGFIAAAAGSAVGLGNIWRFPYETGNNGGGAFLFIYLMCTLIIGFPLIVGEIAVGRRAQANPYGAYNLLGGKRWALVGLFGVLCGIMILSFYNVVAGWAFGHFVSTAFGDLLSKPSFDGHFSDYASTIGPRLYVVSFLFMALTAFIVMKGVQKGIEAASKLLMPFLFIILVGLIIYGLTLNGAMKGVEYYLIPDFSKITLGTVFSAMGQAFFSLSLGMGALITYGSYFSKKDNIVTSAAIVTVVDVSVAFLAGLLIFPLVFSQGLEPGAGPGLVFEVLPGVFQSMGPIMGRIIGGSFFLLLCVAALTSTVSLLEVPVAYLVDEKKWKRGPVVIGLAAFIFIVGLPTMFSFGGGEFFTNFLQYFNSGANGPELVDKSFYDIIDDIFSNIGLPLGGFLLSIFIATKWKTSNLSDEISEGFSTYKGSFVEKFINIMITFICPLVLFLIVLSTILLKFFGIAII